MNLSLDIPEFNLMSDEQKLYFLAGIIENNLFVVKKKELHGYRLKYHIMGCNINTLWFLQQIFGCLVSNNGNKVEIKVSDIILLSSQFASINTPKNNLWRKINDYYIFLSRIKNNQIVGTQYSNEEKQQKNNFIDEICEINKSFSSCVINPYYLFGELESAENLFLDMTLSNINLKKSTTKNSHLPINLFELISRNLNNLFINKEFYLKLIEYKNNKVSCKDGYYKLRNYLTSLLSTKQELLLKSRPQKVLNQEYINNRKNKKLLREKEINKIKEEKKLLKVAIKEKKVEERRQQKELKEQQTAERNRIKKLEQERERQQKQKELDDFYIPLLNNGQFYCKACNQTKSLENFKRSESSYYKYDYVCKKCQYEKYVKPRLKEMCEKAKLWQKNHPEKMREIRMIDRAKPYNRIKNTIKSRLKRYLIDRRNGTNYKILIGCSPKELCQHIESQFTPEMNWQNYGTYWNIDHIIPFAAFNKENKDHLIWANNYKNLRPIIASDNFSKSDELPNGQRASKMIIESPAEFHELIGNLLEQQGITTKQLYLDSLNNKEKIFIIDLH